MRMLPVSVADTVLLLPGVPRICRSPEKAVLLFVVKNGLVVSVWSNVGNAPLGALGFSSSGPAWAPIAPAMTIVLLARPAKRSLRIANIPDLLSPAAYAGTHQNFSR